MSKIYTHAPANLSTWTISATYCYLIGCKCSKCGIIEGFETLNRKNCKMKTCVLELVRKFGRPAIAKINKLSRFETEIYGTFQEDDVYDVIGNIYENKELLDEIHN